MKYANGFLPSMHWSCLNKPPKKAKNLFLVAMGDLFCEWSQEDWIVSILNWCHNCKHEQNFLFLTKNPRRYLEIFDKYPELIDSRFVFGTSIETTEDSQMKQYLAPSAPPPTSRFQAFHDFRIKYPNARRFLSLEPVMNFDLHVMAMWITNLKPETVYIGVDNYHFIPRNQWPSVDKMENLIQMCKGPVWIKKTMPG
jgi:protein gp37